MDMRGTDTGKVIRGMSCGKSHAGIVMREKSSGEYHHYNCNGESHQVTTLHLTAKLAVDDGKVIQHSIHETQ